MLSASHVLRWVQRYVPPDFEKRWNQYAPAVGDSWRVDETYSGIGDGEWPRSRQKKYALDQLASGTSGRLQGGRVSSDVHVLRLVATAAARAACQQIGHVRA